VAGGAFRDSPAQDPARTQDFRRRSRPPPPHPRAQGSNRKLLQRQVRKMTGRGQEQAGGLDSVPGQCLKQTRGRAVKHAGHHEAAAPCCPPTPAATCVITPDEVMRRIQDTTVAFTGPGEKGIESGRWEKHGPFCSHLSSVAAAASHSQPQRSWW
jgi:hypothetical protein